MPDAKREKKNLERIDGKLKKGKEGNEKGGEKVYRPNIQVT
jgi:hypothetical protein